VTRAAFDHTRAVECPTATSGVWSASAARRHAWYGLAVGAHLTAARIRQAALPQAMMDSLDEVYRDVEQLVQIKQRVWMQP